MQRPDDVLDNPTGELEQLRARHVELERQIGEMSRENELLRTLLDHVPAAVTVKSLDRQFLFTNQKLLDTYGMTREQLLSLREDLTLPPDVLGDWITQDQEVIEEAATVVREFVIQTPSGRVFLVVYKFPLYDEDGAPTRIGTVALDVTAQRESEQDRLILQQQVIEAQEATLRELGTPLVPIMDGIVAMPLVGAIDSARAQMIMETLLEGISSQHARVAILDITGVKVVDTQVASALLRAAQAAQLLGARVILTGITGDVAQSLVHLGADLQRIETRGTLQAAIASALGRR